MIHNLYRLSVIFGNDHWRQKLEAMPSFMEVGVMHLTSIGLRSFLLLEITYRTKEIGISDSNFYNRLKHVLTTWFSYSIGVAANKEDGFVMSHSNESNGRTLTYLHKDYAYQKLVESVEELKTFLPTNFLRKNTIIV